MYKSIGIIPAAGKATRFGGLLKELLPAKDGQSLLAHACQRLKQYCDLIVVVTNKEKVTHHMASIGDIVFIEQVKPELLGAIQSAMAIKAEQYYFTMPDTFIDSNVFGNMPQNTGLCMGVFSTKMPNRFGCLVDGIVVDKQELLTPATAWGCLSWTNEAWEDAINNPPEKKTLTDVLNHIIKKHGYQSWGIGNYFDMATIGDYIEYLRS